MRDVSLRVGVSESPLPGVSLISGFFYRCTKDSNVDPAEVSKKRPIFYVLDFSLVFTPVVNTL